jgi:hypothetical protein
VNSPSLTGFTAAEYTISYESMELVFGAQFSASTAAGSFGFGWFSAAPLANDSFGDGYFLQCSIDEDGLVVVLAKGGDVVLQCIENEIASVFACEVTGNSNAVLPFKLTAARAYPDVWVKLDVDHVTSAYVSFSISILGYGTGRYDIRLAPSFTQSYNFKVYTGEDAVGFDPQRRAVSVFGNGADGRIAARDFRIRSMHAKNVPTFKQCVFIGSNFTVDRDTANTFVLNLGAYPLLNGTPDEFRVQSNVTSVTGALVVGSSETNNYLAFSGLRDDGFGTGIPTTYVGERVYDTTTERSELLLFKGEDAAGPLGPDRVRVLSGQFRVDTFANLDANVYVYSRASFMEAGNANVSSIFVVDGNGVGILKEPAVGYELDIQGSSARKLTGTTWLEGSDARIKNDISDADVDECCDIVKSIPLKLFSYDAAYTGIEDDARVFGWIGQDVEAVVERAVTRRQEHGFEDFRVLNSDQLVKIMWGALQRTIQRLEVLEGSSGS